MIGRMAWGVVLGVLVASWSALATAQQPRAAIVVDAQPEETATAMSAARAALAGSGFEIVPDGDLQAARLLVLGDAAAPLDDVAITRLRAEMGIASVARVQVQRSEGALAVAITWTTAAGPQRRFASATVDALPEVIARLTGELVRAAVIVAPSPVIVQPTTPVVAAQPVVVAAQTSVAPAGDAVVQVLSATVPHEVTVTSGQDAWTCTPPCQINVPAGLVRVAGRGYDVELEIPPGMATVETRPGTEVGMIVLSSVLTAVGGIGVGVGLGLWIPAELYRQVTDDIIEDQFYPGLVMWMIGAACFVLGLPTLIEGLVTMRGRARVVPTTSARGRTPGPSFAFGATPEAGSISMTMQF